MRQFVLTIWLLTALAGVTCAQVPAPTPAADDPNAVALHKACEDGDLNKVKTLIGQGTSVNGASGKHGFTPLTGAAAEGHLDIVNYLLQNNAQLDLSDFDGGTPLLHACYNGKPDCALALINAGAHVNYATNSRRTPLMYAVAHGDDQVVSALIEHHANLDDICDDGPAVTWAAASGKFSSLKLLAAAGAKLTVSPPSNPSAYSILSGAVASNDLDMVNFLLDQKIDVNSPDGDGGTAIITAAHRGFAPILQKLIDRGATIDAQNNDGNTALMLSRDANISNILLQHHANTGLKNKKGMTALMMAAEDLNAD